MAKLYFNYSTMNAGKSTQLLQAAHNYASRDMTPYLLTAAIDDRGGSARISSRIGIAQPAATYTPETDLARQVAAQHEHEPIDCVFVDEAQFLTKRQVWQLCALVDDLGIPVICYGLRTDFRGELFPGSAALLALADLIREVVAVCHCGSKATMVARRDADGNVVTSGAQIAIGGEESYVPLCRHHWRTALVAAGAELG
ncbi:MAG: thymidine kinase [Pseudomonadota bacterium]